MKIVFDPAVISYGQLLQIAFSVAHDPTQLNRQCPDVGTQYRSAIFYADDGQKRIAEAYISQLEQAHVFARPIVTRVDPLKGFYAAEGYHQDYLIHNPTSALYCNVRYAQGGESQAHVSGTLSADSRFGAQLMAGIKKNRPALCLLWRAVLRADRGRRETTPSTRSRCLRAASLTDVLQELGDGFTKDSSIPVRFSFAASSALARQIENGAPATCSFRRIWSGWIICKRAN